MVLESIIEPFNAEKEPWEMFFVGILYSSIAIFLSLFIFGGEETSLVFVFLTVMATAILMYKTLEIEEEKDIKIKSEWKLLREHGRALSFFMFLFLGFVVSFALWYIFLPGELPAHVFNTQINTIEKINSPTGMLIGSGIFAKILANNIKVALFAMFFSFFYGLGAIFIITWNASVVGAAIGIYVRNLLNSILVETGALNLAAYFSSFSAGILRYLVHGIPEIAAYFIAGLAGGLVSVAIIHYKSNGKNFYRVLKDASWLMFISLIVLVVAAFIEVYLTPLL